MTAYELIEALKRQPEDAEILIYNNYYNRSSIINDKTPFSEIEHDQDGTPIIWLQCEQ